MGTGTALKNSPYSLRLGHLLAGVVGVRDGDAERPVFGGTFRLLGQDAQNLVEMPQTEISILFQHLETGGEDRPPLARLADDERGKIGHVRLDERLDEGTLGIHLLLFRRRDRLHGRLVVIRRRRSPGGLRHDNTRKRERRERGNWKSAKTHVPHYTKNPFSAQGVIFRNFPLPVS